MLTEVFGVRGVLGDLELSPKLVREQFDPAGEAGVTTLFAGRILELVFHNPQLLDYGDYQIEQLKINEMNEEFIKSNESVVVPREVITSLDPQKKHCLDISLVKV